MRTAFVSGASGVVGYGILRSLRKWDPSLRLVGATIYEDSPAQGFCDVFALAPRTDHADYPAWLAETFIRHRVDIAFPGIEADMYRWAGLAGSLPGAATARLVLNEPRLIALCQDKWEFYQRVRAAGLPCVIDSSLESEFAALEQRFGLPFLLKPRRGFASKGIVRVDSQAAFLPHAARVGGTLMAQPIVGTDDEEYTTSAFCNGAGDFDALMTLRRKLSAEGFTDRAEVVDDADIPGVVRDLCALLRPIGPTNFQFRRHAGVLKLLEINPRVSSATSMRTAFGYNESAMAVEFYLDGKRPLQPAIRAGRAVRYLEDLIFYQ